MAELSKLALAAAMALAVATPSANAEPMLIVADDKLGLPGSDTVRLGSMTAAAVPCV